MNLHRLNARRKLDQRLTGLGLADRVGPRPPHGWVRTIREALGMSSYELAARTGISATRVREHEHAELEGSIRLSALDRLARGLNCTLLYVLVPNEPLELMVQRQARRKAEEVASNWDTPAIDDGSLVALAIKAQLESLTFDLMDRRGLWRSGSSREEHANAAETRTGHYPGQS